MIIAGASFRVFDPVLMGDYGSADAFWSAYDDGNRPLFTSGWLPSKGTISVQWDLYGDANFPCEFNASGTFRPRTENDDGLSFPFDPHRPRQWHLKGTLKAWEGVETENPKPTSSTVYAVAELNPRVPEIMLDLQGFGGGAVRFVDGKWEEPGVTGHITGMDINVPPAWQY